MANSLLKNLAIIFALIALAGCGGDSDYFTISVSPSSKTIGVNKTQKFFATCYGLNNIVLTKTVTWSASASIGTIDASSGMFYAGSSEASGYVTATSGIISTNASVTVTTKGSLYGTITDVDGIKVANIQVYLTQVPTFNAYTDSKGSYAISNIPSGTYEVSTMQTQFYLAATDEASISIGEAKQLNMTLEDRLSVENESENTLTGTVVITGIVRNNGGTTAAQVSVIYTFYDEDGNISASATQDIGNIAPAGTASYTVYAYPRIISYNTKIRSVAAQSY